MTRNIVFNNIAKADEPPQLVFIETEDTFGHGVKLGTWGNHPINPELTVLTVDIAESNLEERKVAALESIAFELEELRRIIGLMPALNK